jgi:hypothetical protein
MEETAMPLRVVMRKYFSSYFLYAARRLSADADAIEAGHEGESRFDIAHRAYVLSSIQAAAGFLEAMVNELYQDAVDEHGTNGDGYIAPLSVETRRTMVELWRATDEGRSFVRWTSTRCFLWPLAVTGLSRVPNRTRTPIS